MLKDQAVKVDYFDAVAAGTGRKLTDFVTYRISRLHSAFNAQAVATLESVSGLTLGQWRVLAIVGSGQAMTSRDIAQESGFDPAFISRTMTSLEKLEYVSTQRPVEDRRVLNVALTAAGRAVYERTFPIMQKRQDLLLGSLTRAEQKMLYGIIDKLEAMAEIRGFEE